LGATREASSEGRYQGGVEGGRMNRFIFWNAPVSKTVRILDHTKGRELFFYGITIGWFGIGFVIGRERKP
jgi:hypothetical protein